MGRPCTICTHAQREAINQALADGYSFRDIASSFAVSKTAVHRHWQAHVATEPVRTKIVPVRASDTARSTFQKWALWTRELTISS
jgi:ribosomal protein S26